MDRGTWQMMTYSEFKRMIECYHTSAEQRNCQTCNKTMCINCYLSYHAWAGGNCIEIVGNQFEWHKHCYAAGKHSEHCIHNAHPNVHMTNYRRVTA